MLGGGMPPTLATVFFFSALEEDSDHYQLFLPIVPDSGLQIPSYFIYLCPFGLKNDSEQHKSQ